MSKPNCTLDQARAAKTRAVAALAAFPVVGIGITRVGGGYGLKVNLSEICESIPSEIDGVPLKSEVVGKIVKRS